MELRLQECFCLDKDILRITVVSNVYEIRAKALKQLPKRKDLSDFVDDWLVNSLLEQVVTVSNPKVSVYVLNHCVQSVFEHIHQAYVVL